MKAFLSIAKTMLKRMSKTTKVVLATSMATVGIASAVMVSNAVMAGFGPTRPVFDWNNPAEQVGSDKGPVFNSFVNTPTYGDERNMTRIAKVVPGQSPVDADFREEQLAEAGQEYWVRTFVHNNANEGLNCLPEHKNAQGVCTQIDNNAPGIAKNTRIRFDFPAGTANGFDIMTHVTSDNGINKDGAAMREVFDTATLRNDQQAFSISYMYQQAFIYNKLHPTGFQFTSEQINGDQGQPLGDDVMDGNLPGCFDASAYVYIKIRVDVPQLVVEKKVRKPGGTEWLESVDAKPGETVQWMVNVRNRGTTTQTNVISNDVVPPHLTYVNNTAKWYTVDFPNGNNYDFDQYEVNDGDGGYNFGNYGAGSNVVIRFDTTVNNDFSECQITLRNVARARSDQFPTDMEDSADVRITKENCQPNQPTYKCDVLEIQHLGGRNYHFTARASGTPGATISRYIYTFGDEAPGAQPFISDKNTVDHTYAKDGTYTATLKVEFTVNGQAQTPVTAATCSKQITAGQPVPPTPTTPGKLPNTGAGDMVALFTAVTFGAAAAHRTYLTKRYGL